MTQTLSNSPLIYKWTGPTGVEFTQVREPSGTYYHQDTPRAVVDTLEYARSRCLRIRMFFGDPMTGKDWHEENNVSGFIGRSSGPIKCPILLHRVDAESGPIISDRSIVRLLMDGREMYVHPQYITPSIEVESHDNRWQVLINGNLRATFKSQPKAQRWAAFMRGERMTK